MAISKELEEKIHKLQRKYESSGQDMLSYLEGLIHQDYLNYWDYINLDVLLNLQQPRTSLPDEEVFIIYHQITELYFKLCIHTLQQITDKDEPSVDEFKKHLRRLNGYWSNLVHSYQIMVEGMDKEQFLNFRMALLPASGFQSAQYRIIEMMSTDAVNLTEYDKRAELEGETDVKKLYEYFYWKQGGKELATGKKTLTLVQFEEKYTDDFIKLLKDFKDKNVHQKFQQLPEADRDEELVELLRDYDVNVQIKWPLMHYRSAVRYLHKKPEDIAATGGTNWQKYLPPKFQKIYFFPDLFSEKEKEQWGTKTNV